MNYDETIVYLYSRGLFAIKLGLNNITELMEKLGNPQRKFKSIHIAGTNGKGSVCAFLSSILQKQGYKVGVYTSPHLVDFRERIRINNKKISKNKVVSLVERIKPLVDTHTYFEIVTAMAFLYFKEQKVDFALVEVGMGGRLDATNVIKPEVAVITSISKEHTKHLGKTIEKITYEKAGIIKKGVDVVASVHNDGLKQIKPVCHIKDCRLNLVEPAEVESNLKGRFQYENLGIALKVIELLREKGYEISEESVKAGFDCAHNPDGAETLVNEINNLSYDRLYVILGIMKDKDIEGICRPLEKIADEIIVTKPEITRAAEPEEIKNFIKKEVRIIRNVKEALDYAMGKAKKKDLVVLTGSIFTVGEGFSAIKKDPFG